MCSVACHARVVPMYFVPRPVRTPLLPSPPSNGILGRTYPPPFREGDPHLPPTTPELKQNRRSAILSVLFQEEDTSLVHYGDPPTPTRVRDVSDGGRHNRAPVSGDRDGRGQLCLCSPRYGGTSTLRAPAGLGGPARPRELGLCLVRLVFRFQWRLVYYLSGPVPPSTFDLTSHSESTPSTFTTFIPISLHPFLLSQTCLQVSYMGLLPFT